ncbi:unnamed protein product [Pleuronectes platessa]|uniref:Uncharacterized protein n=1 Tax=Pleuronectes platessa TaxID=8262 RepID=A0A9N7VBB7_PLEPL|nr:unnamed protein product [Pleuronectes platessa]
MRHASAFASRPVLPGVRRSLPFKQTNNMDNSDEPEDLLDGKIVFQKNKDRTFSKTKQYPPNTANAKHCVVGEAFKWNAPNQTHSPGHIVQRSGSRGTTLAQPPVCSALRFNMGVGMGARGLALRLRLASAVASRSGVNPA